VSVHVRLHELNFHFIQLQSWACNTYNRVHRVLEKSLKIQGLESPWKQSRSLKVLDFECSIFWNFCVLFAHCCATRCHILRPKCTNSISAGAPPQTPPGELSQHSPRPLAGCKGDLHLREWREGQGRSVYWTFLPFGQYTKVHRVWKKRNQ